MTYSKRIKITALEIGHLSKTAVSGGDLLLEKMYPYLKKNISLSIIVPEIGASHWQKHKITLYKLKANIFDKVQNKFFFFFSYLIRIYHSYNILKKIDFEIIYSSTNIFPDVAAACLLNITMTHPPKKWVARVHHLISPPNQREGNFITNSLAYLLQKLTLILIKKADLVIALNRSLYNDLAKLGISPKKMAVLGGGTSITKIRKIKSQDKFFDAIFIGRLHPTKGILDLIEIWEKVSTKRKKAKLAIAGEGRQTMLKKIKKQIQTKKLSKNITILGYLPQNALYKALKSSKMFLFTDKEAGWGLAVAEAMTAGLPVVAYNLPIFGDVYKKGFVTVPKGEKSLFANKVINLINNKKLLKELGSQAQSQARLLDWSRTARRFLKIINRL